MKKKSSFENETQDEGYSTLSIVCWALGVFLGVCGLEFFIRLGKLAVFIWDSGVWLLSLRFRSFKSS